MPQSTGTTSNENRAGRTRRMAPLARVLEAALLVAAFGSYIHLLLSRPATIVSVLATFVLAVMGLGLTLSPWGRRRLDPDGLWASVLGIAGGFWIFVFLCMNGLAQWPMGRAATTSDYAHLLYSHCVLAATMLAAVLWTSNWHGDGWLLLRWGAWLGRGRWRGLLLVGTAVGAWIWALGIVWRIGFNASGSLWIFVGIAFAKACLTSGTEELCYRGIILPAARKRFGPTAAIVLQAVLFATFHLYLSPMFASSYVFVACVAGLGLVLGAVTHLTSGIGWAFVAHGAIDMVVEWQNIYTSS